MADNYIEETRYLYLNTPLGADKLILLTFNGFESFSELFRFQLEVAAKKDDDIAFDQIIGKTVDFGVKGTDDADPRHFDGVCIEFSEGARDVEFKYYTIVVAPKLWMLTQRRTCKIFQQKSVQDILTTVLTGIDTDMRLQGTYDPREFCVQYNETDFDFASRLMEEEGIYYYFKFDESSHTMVIADTPQGYTDVPGATTYTFDTASGGNRFADQERVSSWRRIQSWSSAKYTLWDHHFQLTDKHLDADKTMTPETVAGGTITHKLKLSGNDAFEIYEYPGNYAKRYDGISTSGGEQASELNKIFTDNTRTVGIRMKQVATADLVFTGNGNCRRFTAGHKFTLSEHFDGDGQYVLMSVTHTAQEGDFRSGADINVEHYENTFTCIPMALPFLPARKTPRPRVFGCQTAKVVGPPGEEIFTDKYGRVKVQFRWDREGQENSSSSCWLRVGSPWAGKNWGMIHIPRIGQEVIVDFMEGDPDRPIVVGSVYNPDQMPPYKLPDNKTQSGIQTRSTKGGGAANYNEIRFEDLKGSELLTVHAEKDRDTQVENDDAQLVGHDQTIKVDNNRTEVVGAVEKVNVKGDRHNKIDGNHYEQIAQGHSEKVGQDLNIKVGQNAGIDAGMNISLKGGVNIVLEASMAITLKGSGGFITIGPAGVMISGTMVLINSGGAAIPGVPVVAIPPVITPPVAPIAPIPGTSTTAPGATGPVTMAAIPSLSPLPPAPNVAAMANQVASVMNSSVNSAAQSLSGLTGSLMQQLNALATQLLDQAQHAGDEVAAVQSQITAAVNDAQKQLDNAITDAKGQVENAVNEVSAEAQQQLQAAAGAVADLENQAGQALQGVQQQMQQVANQAEQMAQQAEQQAQAALAQAAQAAQNAAHQAQQLANQAEQQVQQVAAQAEQAAQNAAQQGQQALNAASQQLNSVAQQAQQGVQQVQQQVQNAVQQTQAMAQQAMQQGEQAMAQAGQQAQQAAQQAQQQVQQAAGQAQQAAQKAEQQAAQAGQQAVQGVQNAAQQAGAQVQNAAKQGEQQISGAAQQATQQAQQAGQMAQQSAQQVSSQVTKTAGQAAGQVGQAANQAFGQVGNSAGQAVSSLKNSLGGLGK
ncbi:MAG TPA: type VI secretion system tip protein TssI/VgrG [Bryobacteraceae bacterium]